jgi:hypothetical protein
MNDTNQPMFTSGPTVQRPPIMTPNQHAAAQSVKAAEQILGTINALYEKTCVVEGRVAGTEVLLSQVVAQVVELADAAETVLALSDTISRLIAKAKANPSVPMTFNDFLIAVEQVDKESEAGGGYVVPSGTDAVTPVETAPVETAGYVVEGGGANP